MLYTMVEKRITLEHNGEEFQYTVEEVAVCQECNQHIRDIIGLGRCPHCGEKSKYKYFMNYHFFIKEIWWVTGELDENIETYTEALRFSARRLEALTANGWEISKPDNEYLFFSKEMDTKKPVNEYKIDDELE